MIVLCDDMEKIGFRDPEQRRAKPSGMRLIEWLIWLERWRPLMRTVILMFSQRGGCEEVFKTLCTGAFIAPSFSERRLYEHACFPFCYSPNVAAVESATQVFNQKLSSTFH